MGYLINNGLATFEGGMMPMILIIGVMLMYLHTGYRPSKYLFALLSSGASLDDLLPHRIADPASHPRTNAHGS